MINKEEVKVKGMTVYIENPKESKEQLFKVLI
jgi:hypothetical protein